MESETLQLERLVDDPETNCCGSLRTRTYPVWQYRPFRELKRRDVTALLDQIEDDHGARQADVVLAIIGKLTNWYQVRNDDYVSPVVRGMKKINAKARARSRFLSDDEVRALWKACTDMGTPFGAIVKLLLLTGQRREKVATMRWSDIKQGVWTIPTEPREKSNVGIMALSPVALEIIEAQPRLAGSPYVFAGSKRGRTGQRFAHTDVGTS